MTVLSVLKPRDDTGEAGPEKGTTRLLATFNVPDQM
jgi:hypothetical protein